MSTPAAPGPSTLIAVTGATGRIGGAADAVFTLARTRWAAEERLRASGMGFTLLRDSLRHTRSTY